MTSCAFADSNGDTFGDTLLVQAEASSRDIPAKANQPILKDFIFLLQKELKPLKTIQHNV